MGRTFSSVCMAFCGIVGVFLLFNVCILAPGVLLRAAKTGANAAFWEAIVAYFIGAVIAIALLAVALFIRRRLKALDAKVEEAEIGENSN